MKIHIHTLGCKVNQFESQALETIFTGRGHEITSDETDCDAVIINTCAVTAESVRKSRQAVRRFRAQNPAAVIGICGCWPQAEADDALKLGDVVFGSGDRAAFALAVERAYGKREKELSVDDVFSRTEFERLPAGSSQSRTRALLKIEDGCANFCAYCIIPYTRGRVRSLPVEECAHEAARLASEGYREIVVTGIEIASYGRDLGGGLSLIDAVEAIANAAPDCRIRLGSLEPRVVTRDFCERAAKLMGLCPHFHLSLQSGCDETLRRMRRKYDTARFFESVELLREYFPSCGIAADLIVGFPAETDEEFQATMSFIERCRFSSVHVFPYSVRSGTAAESMPDKIDKSVKQSRARAAGKAAARMHEEFLRSMVGSLQSVLFEQETDGVWHGHTPNYAEVYAEGDGLHNAVVNVQITDLKNGALWGKVLL